jgi:prepilin-type N-terminal cleavage/methylation domain-containing protein
MTDRKARGFTLIELLVVMAILGMLVGLGVTVIPYLMRKGPKTAAQTFVSTLGAGLEAYKGTEGAYPPTTLAEFPGVGQLQNQENLGIESVVVCLNATRYSGSFAFDETPGGKLDNLDGDFTQIQITRFGDKTMFEVLDPWMMPYAYFNARDYMNPEPVGKITGEGGLGSPVAAKPWMNPKTKRPYRSDSFQIISAGPDKTFNTDDDITNFDRE